MWLACRIHQLEATIALKSQNKKLICPTIIEDETFHKNHLCNHKFVITEKFKMHFEIRGTEIVIERNDMNTNHKEVDIVQQMFIIANEKKSSGITIVSDDVLILVLYY